MLVSWSRICSGNVSVTNDLPSCIGDIIDVDTLGRDVIPYRTERSTKSCSLIWDLCPRQNGIIGFPRPNLRENGSFQQRFLVYTAMSICSGGLLLRTWTPRALGDEYVEEPTMWNDWRRSPSRWKIRSCSVGKVVLIHDKIPKKSSNVHLSTSKYILHAPVNTSYILRADCCVDVSMSHKSRL